MDRNIGALTAGQSGNARGTILYQVARKDPFPANITLYNINGVALTATAPANFLAQKWSSTANCTSFNVQTAVKYPMSFSTTNYHSGSYGWGDGKLSYAVTATDFTNQTNGFGKSVVDPCPPGWKIPIASTFQDFSKTAPRQTASMCNTSSGNVRPFPVALGMFYYPYYDTGDGTYPIQGTIFFPMNGIRAVSNGIMTVIDGEGNIRQFNGADLFYQGGNVLTVDRASASSTYGFATRCISMPPKP